jgi:hypothetical protein
MVMLSVVLCTHNGSQWLPEMLASLLRQVRRPDEVVIHDDCSTDDTLAMLREFQGDAPFEVRIAVNDERLGSTRNFERALAASRGEIVVLADQDDVWYPRKLERLVEIMDDDPILTLVFSDADLIDEYGAPASRTLWEARTVSRYLRDHEVVPGTMFARRALSTGCTLAARRRAVDAALPFPAVLDSPCAPMRHDRWLSLVAGAVGTVRAVNEPLLAFRVHPTQQTGVLARRQLAARLADSVRDALLPRGDGGTSEHLVRAAQVAEAAERADKLGDFGEADALRSIVAHHRFRSDPGRTPLQRLRAVASELLAGRYDRSPLGIAGAIADAAKAVTQPAPRSPHP